MCHESNKLSWTFQCCWVLKGKRQKIKVSDVKITLIPAPSQDLLNKSRGRKVEFTASLKTAKRKGCRRMWKHGFILDQGWPSNNSRPSEEKETGGGGRGQGGGSGC